MNATVHRAGIMGQGSAQCSLQGGNIEISIRHNIACIELGSHPRTAELVDEGTHFERAQEELVRYVLGIQKNSCAFGVGYHLRQLGGITIPGVLRSDLKFRASMPSESGPPRWVQASSMAWKVPATRIRRWMSAHFPFSGYQIAGQSSEPGAWSHGTFPTACCVPDSGLHCVFGALITFFRRSSSRRHPESSRPLKWAIFFRHAGFRCRGTRRQH